MRADELTQGHLYYVSQIGMCRLVSKGQGHGPVHTIEQLHPVTGEVMTDRNGVTKVVRNCTSRDVLRIWSDHLTLYPQYVENFKRQEDQRTKRDEDAKVQREFAEMLEGVCADTAGLLNALGFEATVVSNAPGYPDRGYYIKIDNPTQNQDLLRRMVAEKWKETLGE